MAYAKFTRTMPTSTIVYVNPNNVACVDTFNNFTRIFFNSAGAEAQLTWIGVTNPINQVITALEAASQ